MGCIFGNPMSGGFSGDFKPDDTRLTGHSDGPIQPAFVPPGLDQAKLDGRSVRRVAISELGEANLPESVVRDIAGSAKDRREVIVIPGTPFKPPVGSLERTWDFVARRALANAVITTQPSTDPASSQPSIRIDTKIEVTSADFERISAEFEAESRKQVLIQSAKEVKRLCSVAQAQNADALLLVTCYRHVGKAEGTGFGFLNYLILPAFIIPTERFKGETSAYGWLIDPADGRVIRSVHWEDRYKRYSPLVSTDDRRDDLWEDQRENALSEVANKLLDAQ
jgi:hypothetical protein